MTVYSGNLCTPRCHPFFAIDLLLFSVASFQCCVICHPKMARCYDLCFAATEDNLRTLLCKNETFISVCLASKKVHGLLLGSSKITTQFAEELQSLRHPKSVLLSWLATARAADGATAQQPSRSELDPEGPI